MGEYKLEHISDLLFEHMVVGMIFFTHPNTLSIDTIEQICKQEKISKLSPLVATADLVSHGIISAHIDDKQNVCYEITEFGQYFLTRFVRQVYMHENCVRKYEGICYE